MRETRVRGLCDGEDWVDYIDALIAYARQVAQERDAARLHLPEVAAPSNQRIAEAHSSMPPEACYTEKYGQHRSYRQGHERCFICTLLERAESAEAQCAAHVEFLRKRIDHHLQMAEQASTVSPPVLKQYDIMQAEEISAHLSQTTGEERK